jgi:glutaredoxin 3
MKEHNVIVYSTPTCPYCVMAKEYFKQNNVAFTDKNVAVDRAAAQEMIMKSGQMGVPVIDIDGTIMVGFQPNEFQNLLSK